MSRTLHKSCSAHRRPRLLRTPGGGVQCQLFLPAHCLTGKATDEIVDRRQTVYYTALSSRPSACLSCHKGTFSGIARTQAVIVSSQHVRTGGERKMSGKPVDASACRWPATTTLTTWRTGAGCWPTASRSSRMWGAGRMESTRAILLEVHPPAWRLCECGGYGPSAKKPCRGCH